MKFYDSQSKQTHSSIIVLRNFFGFKNAAELKREIDPLSKHERDDLACLAAKEMGYEAIYDAAEPAPLA